MSHAQSGKQCRAKVRLTAAFVFLVVVPSAARAQAAMSVPVGGLPPTAAQIVQEMQSHNAARAAGLKHYHSLRHYTVEYRGFSARIAAKMDVEADYDAASGKSFRVVSQSGSNLLVDKVLKRLVESEKDASDQHSAELTPANYRFSLAGMEKLGDRVCYVLEVEPVRDNKYLYKGKVWIDAAEFALTRIEAAPSRNPSFWVSSVAIHHSFARTDGYWLPVENRSETKVRIGGRAVLTIDYGTYDIEPAFVLSAGGN